MNPETQDLLDRLDGLDRGSPAWVNIADALATRIRGDGGDDGAPAGDLEVEADKIILDGLSETALEAFTYADEQCRVYGMEIIAPIIGYPDERDEVLEVVQTAIQKWRTDKDGVPPPEGIEPAAEEEAAPEEQDEVASA